MESRIAAWRVVWVIHACALGVHVLDEALTGFLPVYNQIVLQIRAEHTWILLPRFTFPIWIGGLSIGVLLLLALTRFVSSGARWLQMVSIFLGVIMTGNALLHLGGSIYLSRMAPGVYSSPLLLLAAIALLITAARARAVPVSTEESAR